MLNQSSTFVLKKTLTKRFKRQGQVFLFCLLSGLVLGGGLSACAPCCGKSAATSTTYVMSAEPPARVPAGVERYCWEEPMVELEPTRPGIDSSGHWYHPSYLAVREVRQGRWRPCREVKSEVVRGETRERGQ